MLRVDDEFFEPETGKLIKVMSVSPHGEFVSLYELYEATWIIVMNPVRTEELIRKIKRFELIPNTEAGRLFYAKED